MTFQNFIRAGLSTSRCVQAHVSVHLVPRVGAGLIAASLMACGQPNTAQSPAAPQALPARVGHASMQPVANWYEYTGRFEATKRVELRARVSGYVESINFVEGQIVNAADVLYVIEQRPFQIALDAAKARYALAVSEFERAQKLQKSGAMSQENFETRQQQMLVAKADKEQAELDLDHTEIKAPFGGRVGRSYVEVGTLVNGDAALLTTVVTTDPIEFTFEGSEADILRYKRARLNDGNNTQRGSALPVFARLQDEKSFDHKGQINFLDNEFDRSTGSISVRAEFDNSHGLFEPGMFARVRVLSGAPQQQLVVPQTIIGAEQTRRYVYTLDDNNQAVRTYITLGSTTDDGKQVVMSGLDLDDRVVLGGLQMVRPGAVIQPLPAAPNAEPQQDTAATPVDAEADMTIADNEG